MEIRKQQRMSKERKKTPQKQQFVPADRSETVLSELLAEITARIRFKLGRSGVDPKLDASETSGESVKRVEGGGVVDGPSGAASLTRKRPIDSALWSAEAARKSHFD